MYIFVYIADSADSMALSLASRTAAEAGENGLGLDKALHVPSTINDDSLSEKCTPDPMAFETFKSFHLQATYRCQR